MNFFSRWIAVLILSSIVATAAPTPPHAAQAMQQVIIQVLGSTDTVVATIRNGGGTITHELPILNAVAATVPTTLLPTLAANATVQTISTNTPIQNAGLLNRPLAQKRGNTATPAMLSNHYLDTLNVRPVWAMGLDGTGIGVAVIDSGISPDNDLPNIAAAVTFSPNASTTNDHFGHGTHVAGILAGNGADSNGLFQGIAPGVQLLNLKVGNDQGLATEADVVAAMQWVLEHKAEYNIRVVNLSINSTFQSSYHVSPLSAAAEILWFNGIVVVTATGNKQEANGFNPVLAAPANDPFVITVGASDEKGDAERKNDRIATFTAYDQTAEGYVKPEIMAPGVDIISVLSANSTWPAQYPERMTADGQYFRLSGASMSTPMVTGAVALLLQAEPNLTPDQVKYRLLQSAGKVAKARYLDIYAMITQKTTESANGGIPASQLLWTGSEPVQWQSVNWNAVNWNAVNWNAVNWNAVNWNAVNWNSASWSN